MIVREAFKNKNRTMTNRRLTLLFGLPFIILLSTSPLRAQQPSTDDLRKEIQELRQSVKEMQKDLQEIKALLLSRAPAAPPESVVLVLSSIRLIPASNGEVVPVLTS